MRHSVFCNLLFLFISTGLCANDAPIVDLHTNFGIITVQLDRKQAPITTNNFLAYVGEDFYANTLFHRIVPGFVVQGGGFTPQFVQKPTHPPIVLESKNGLSNLRGTIAMARTNEPNSATVQFFINTVDNKVLDYVSDSQPGYTVFGQVIADSMAVVDKISAVPTQNEVPVQQIVIEAARPRHAQIQFSGLRNSYHIGEPLQVVVEESQIVREHELDLWVALVVHDQLYFISPELPGSLGSIPRPFKRKVPIRSTSHEIINLPVNAAMIGDYQLLAMFNEQGKDVTDIRRSLRSNLASALVQIK